LVAYLEAVAEPGHVQSAQSVAVIEENDDERLLQTSTSLVM